MKTKSRRRKNGVLTIRYVLIFLWLIFTLIPLYTAFVASLTRYENLGKTFLFPVDFEWHNYIDIFTRIPYGSYFKATLLYAVGTSLVSVVFAAFAAYGLSRFRFRGKMFYTGFIFITQLLPQVVIVVPVFMLLKSMGLYDSYLGVVIAVTATSMAFPILLLRSFFDGLPVALEEAASIDGCSRLGILVRIVVPLAAPGMATAFALSFFTGWGQYLYPLVLTRSADKTPLTVGISRMIDNQTPWEMVMTGTLLSIIPAVVIYLFVQKFLVKGLTVGGVK